MRATLLILIAFLFTAFFMRAACLAGYPQCAIVAAETEGLK